MAECNTCLTDSLLLKLCIAEGPDLFLDTSKFLSIYRGQHDGEKFKSIPAWWGKLVQWCPHQEPIFKNLFMIFSFSNQSC
jgi:hypothetical protein